MALPRSFAPRCALIVAAIGLSAVSGCSSSSSGGSANRALTQAAAHSETFRHVSVKANHVLQGTLPLMRGVANTTYQGSTLRVTFKPDAKKIDQTNVENIVRQSRQESTATKKKPSPAPGRTAK